MKQVSKIKWIKARKMEKRNKMLMEKVENKNYYLIKLEEKMKMILKIWKVMMMKKQKKMVYKII